MLGPALAGYPSLGLTPSVALGGMGIALLLGALAGVVPAMLAFRANITEALRTV
jgi:ABC-type antimicrobial peptide transport system permease subunit